MKSFITPSRIALLLVLLASLLSFTLPASSATAADPVPQSSYAAMRWRLIGPHRGGRALAACGVRGQPETFYFGAVGGGVWKTTDAGHVWTPIFDSQPIASIGALAVAPSDANVIYVGTGEADMRSDISFGDGMYKSTDAGKSWTHIGLSDTQQIARIIVDPRDANVVLVAALGHGFGANAERGVFRTTDGGKTWSKVLYKDENTGAIELAADPDDARIVYAALWNVRRTAWSNTYAPITRPGGGLYKSTDGGQTWRELKGHGLPDGTLGRIGIGVASSAQGGAQKTQQPSPVKHRVYALIEAEGTQRGLYRSDDAGETWQQVSTDARLSSRSWYFSGITVDPHNADAIYVANVALYRSTDAGRTFQTIKGAPGGDDYHALWIDPDTSQRMILASDQGTVISVDGGQTWSSWYNQPTAQFYHVVVDTHFPYRVYGAQQDSGTAAVTSRSDYGQISFRDWQPIGAGESGNILPDPVNPDIVWGGSTSGEMYRYDRRTGQVQDVTPAPDSPHAKVKARYPWTTPIAFSPHAPYALYQASQFLFKTTNGGASWETISPDLTLHEIEVTLKASGLTKEDVAKAVSYSLALSPVSAGTIWVGTDNGLIQLTRDEGRSWQNVAPKELPGWSIISLIEASPFDAATAYVAVDRHQSDDLNPYIYRTHDFGQTWTRINEGIPAPAFVRAVRADPVRKGLLYAGTELGVYVSFDDGAHWQSLQLNLPVASVRDLVIKDNDLVVATHGRSFWILDNLTPLRQFDAAAVMRGDNAHLYNPAAAIRLRQNENRDTPLPPETPTGQNPSTGAIIDYDLKSVPEGALTIEILDARGSLVRKFSSTDATRKVEDVQSFATYWLRPPAPPTKNAGHNRFVWDLRYAQPRALHYEYNIAAVPNVDTPADPQGALVLPGVYQVRLTVNGRTTTAVLRIELDPRVKVEAGALEAQLALEMKISDALNASADAVREIQDLRAQLKAVQARASNTSDGKAMLDAARALDEKAATLIGEGARAATADTDATDLTTLNNYLAALMATVGASDAAPTTQAASAFDNNRQAILLQMSAWELLKTTDLKNLNILLQARGMPAITLHTNMTAQ